MSNARADGRVAKARPSAGALALADGAQVLWHGVDAVELSWTVPCRLRLSQGAPDQLDQTLTMLKRRAVQERRRVESGWSFDAGDGPDPLMVHAEALLRSPYALQCASFLLRVNFESPTRPRAVVQLRTALLHRLGAHAAVLAVSRWLDVHLLPLVDGRVAQARPRAWPASHRPHGRRLRRDPDADAS